MVKHVLFEKRVSERSWIGGLFSMVIYVFSAPDSQKHVSFCNFLKTRKNTYRQDFWDPREADFVAISRECATLDLLG